MGALPGGILERRRYSDQMVVVLTLGHDEEDAVIGAPITGTFDDHSYFLPDTVPCHNTMVLP